MRILTTILILTSVLLFGCKTKESNPELRDPIYNDMVKEAAGAKALAETAKKKIESLEKDLEKYKTRSIDRINTEADIKKQRYLLSKYEEFSEYYTIRAARRKFESRKKYNTSFADGTPWPDEKEYKSYLTNKELVRASRNWNDRVPKTGKGGTIDPPKPEVSAE